MNSLQKRLVHDLNSRKIQVEDINESCGNTSTANLSDYKFYISAIDGENCQGFAAEDLRLAYQHRTVPVVFGPFYAKLLKFLPENSFINAENFTTTNDLTDYLQYLNQNESLYQKYLVSRHPNKVRAVRTVEDDSSLYKLCAKYWDARQDSQPSVVDSLTDYILNNDFNKCMES